MRDLVAAGRLVMLGVVQEQHAERAQLFADWKSLDFPILHDPINRLGCSAVPITVAIDQQGIVQSTRPSRDWVRTELVGNGGGEQVGAKPQLPSVPALNDLERTARSSDSATAWQNWGDAVMLWRPDKVTQAIGAYQNSLKLAPTAECYFRLGVAYRHRNESADREVNDFANAVANWTTALRQNPNQYIWRRRIQQYGPRLDKPYPFYDWVENAVVDITARDGKPPTPLTVPLSGAELAPPLRNKEEVVRTPRESKVELSPDPRNQIHRDTRGLVRIASTVVSASQPDRDQYRLHLQFSVSSSANWNNEAEPIEVWFEDTDGITLETRRLRHRPRVESAESREDRVLDVEFSRKTASLNKIRGFALYYVCEKETQQCILLRQDFTIPIRIEKVQ